MEARQRWLAACVALAVALPVPAQTPPPAASPAPAPAAAPASKTFSQEQLDQIMAPIALYPDQLLAQVLMASTYPLDIVAAARWVKANPGLKDKALQDALEKQPWDPSVKSLTAFPQVLDMMDQKLEWTQQLGDAFLAQQQDVMATAQALRQKAQAQGSLKDTKEQKVVTEGSGSTTIIKIEPSSPEVVYVPTYNPTVVYGAWPYPAYPPYYYYPPGYVAGGALLGFTAGVIVGGALWGNCNWGRGDVNVDVNRYNNFNRTNIQNNNWQHNADRRGAVPYKDQRVAQQYQRGGAGGARASTSDAYRGRTDGASAANRANAGARDVSAGAGGRDFSGGAGNRDVSGTRGGAFDTGSAARTNDFSNRGGSSLDSARSSGNLGAHASPMSSGSRPSGGASAGSRPSGGGGGGARGGGGGGGRGGGGRGGGGGRR